MLALAMHSIQFTKWQLIHLSRTGIVTCPCGACFYTHIIVGMLLESGFGFATCGEGKGDSWKNSKFECHLQLHRSDFLLPASAPLSLTKPRSSTSVLKAVSSNSIAWNAESIFAASYSFDDRSMFLFSWYWLLLTNYFSSCVWWLCQRQSHAVYVHRWQLWQSLIMAPVS